jgi:HEAT repeat protein
MTAPSLGPFGILVFCFACVGSATLLVLLVGRAARRSERDASRSRTAQLLGILSGRVAGHVPLARLKSAARDAGAAPFWNAMEAIASTLRRRERVQLARTLARNRHVIAERRALLTSDSDARRELAARRLALLPSLRHRTALRRALVRGPEPVRLASARALAMLRDAAALRWLFAHPEALATRPLPTLSGLLRAFGPGARAELIGALDRGIAAPRFECALLDALGITRCRSARERIEMRLASPALDVRVAAARALGRLEMGESIPSLVLALADGAWPVRAQAARALGRLRATPAVDALAERVADGAWWVRHHAAYALAAIGPEGRDALCEIFARSGDGYAREMAREALDRAAVRTSA